MFAALESLNDQTDETLVDDINEDTGLDNGFDPSLELDEDDDDEELEEALESIEDDYAALESLDEQTVAIENLLTLRETIATHGMSTSLLAYADPDGYLASKSLVPACESFTGTYKADSASSEAALEALGETIKESVGGFVKKAWDTLTGFVTKITGAAKSLVSKFTGLFKKAEGAEATEVEHGVSPVAATAAVASLTAIAAVVLAVTKLPIPKQVAAAPTYKAKVVAYVKNVKIAKPLGKYFRGLQSKATAKAGAAKDFVVGKYKWTKAALADLLRKVIALFKDGGAINSAAKTLYSWAGTAFKAVRGAVGTGVRAVFGAVRFAITKTAGLLWGAVKSTAGWIWKVLKGVTGAFSRGYKAVRVKLADRAALKQAAAAKASRQAKRQAAAKLAPKAK